MLHDERQHAIVVIHRYHNDVYAREAVASAVHIKAFCTLNLTGVTTW